MADERPTVDFAVEQPGHDGVKLLVEARNVTAPSKEWATLFLRNLFAHGDVPRSDYFLLALRNHLYLWRDPRREAAPPDFEGDTTSALQPYLMRLPYPLETLSQNSFGLLIHAFLYDLVAGTLPEGDDLRWVDDSGLAESVRDGSIRSKIAA